MVSHPLETGVMIGACCVTCEDTVKTAIHSAKTATVPPDPRRNARSGWKAANAGTRWHQSLRTNDERTAIRLVNRIIETGRLEFDEPRTTGVTVRQAIEGFLAEQASRGMADSTLKSFRKFLIGSPNRAKCRNPEKFSPTLMEFAIGQAIETLTAFVAKPDLVAKFRQRWRVSQTTSLKAKVDSAQWSGGMRFAATRTLWRPNRPKSSTTA